MIYEQKCLVPLHPTNSIEITNFNKSLGLMAFSQETKTIDQDGGYVINFNDKNSKGTQWVSLFISQKKDVSFDSFGIEYIPQEVLNKIKDKSITHNIFRILDNESVMGGFYCITFIEYMLPGKTL